MPTTNMASPYSGIPHYLGGERVRFQHWAGFSKSANTAILYLPRSMGGLNLPLLSTLHKKLQVSRQRQLMTSRDGCVRFLADRTLRSELRLSRKKFRPAAAARDILVASPGGSRRKLLLGQLKPLWLRIPTSPFSSTCRVWRDRVT